VTEDVVRIGPFGDRYDGREAYVAFISGLIPTLPGYGMDVSRITHARDYSVVELTENVEVDGAPTVTREVLVLGLEGASLDQRIARIEIYIQRAAAS
jgi:hypothetical protein